MKRLVILLICILPFLSLKCAKNYTLTSHLQSTDVLPPETQSGANKFGFLLNGNVWIPKSIPASETSNLDVQYYKGRFILSAKRKNSKSNPTVFQSISWGYNNIYGPGTYYFKNENDGSYQGADFHDWNSQCDYNTQDQKQDSLNNYVTITRLDSQNRIISGTFNMILYPTGTGCDTVRLTNGRFDAVYFY